MTDEPRKAFDIDAMFEDMFGVPTRKPDETAEEWLARRDARLLPPEYAAHYTLVEVAGGMFGGDLVKCPGLPPLRRAGVPHGPGPPRVVPRTAGAVGGERERGRALEGGPMTKRWNAETASGGPEYLAAALQRVQDVDRGEVFCVLTNPGPYLSWTVVWTTEDQAPTRRAAAAEELAGAAV